MQDMYYQRSEVSNSDLTELKNLLYPRTQYGDKEKAFKFGSLIDAMITEPERVRYDKHMVDDVLYSGEDWELAEAMKKSLRMEARHDPFLAQVLAVLIIHLVIVWIQGAFIQVFQPVFDFARPFVTL